MTDNLQVWNNLKTPPKSALKEIKAGRLKGMNDINPQWRIMAMTQQFGICGIGWKYTIDKQWTEDAANGEVLAFVNVSVYIRDGEKWSDAIPANGGSKLTAKESNGLYNSDEAYKMAFTDALGVAMKMLGMAADVYLGVFDGKNNQPQPKQPEQSKQSAQQKPNEIITASEWEKFESLVKQAESVGVEHPVYERSKMDAGRLNGISQYLNQEIAKRKEGK